MYGLLPLGFVQQCLLSRVWNKFAETECSWEVLIKE